MNIPVKLSILLLLTKAYSAEPFNVKFNGLSMRSPELKETYYIHWANDEDPESNKYANAIIDWVLDNIKNKEMEKQNIKVTENEVDEFFVKNFGDFDEYKNKVNADTELLIKALREVKVHPEKSKEIFKNNLSDSMSLELWEMHVKKDYSAKEINEFSSMSPVDDDQKQNIKRQFYKILRDKKLSSLFHQKGDSYPRWYITALYNKTIVIEDVNVEKAYIDKVRKLYEPYRSEN